MTDPHRLLLEKNKDRYRFFLAKYQQITGLPAVSRTLQSFMSDFDFDRRSLQVKKGLGPVACAALSEDAHLVAQLVQQKACLQTSARLIPEIDVFEGYTPAHFACLVGFDAALQQLLLRADPEATCFGATSCLSLWRSPGAVELWSTGQM